MEHSKGITFTKTIDELNQILRAANGMTTEEVLSAIHAWKKTDYLQKLYNAMLAGVLTTAEAVKYITHGREMEEVLSMFIDAWHEDGFKSGCGEGCHHKYCKAERVLAKLDKEA